MRKNSLLLKKAFRLYLVCLPNQRKKEWSFVRDIKGLLESVSVDNRGAVNVL